MQNGQYIKQLRENRNLSQRELSLLVGISNAEISRIENGLRQEPSPKILKDIASVLKINYLELFLKYRYIEEDLLEGKVIIRENEPSLASFTNEEILLELLRRERLKNGKFEPNRKRKALGIND